MDHTEIDKIRALIKILPQNKSPGLDSSPGEFCQTFKEELTSNLKLFQKL